MSESSAEANPTFTFPLISEEGFPYGVRCMECERVMLPGTPYASRLSSLLADGTAVCDLVCPDCAVGGGAGGEEV